MLNLTLYLQLSLTMHLSCKPMVYRVMSSLPSYVKQHKNPQGPGDDRPTALQIIQDQGLTGKLQDKVFLITGCTSGLGVETARALHTTGADIYITARDIQKGAQVAEDIRSDGVGRLEVIKMELDSFESIRTAARTFLGKSDRLNVLINNAGNFSIMFLVCCFGRANAPSTGVMASPEGRTKDGFETQFGTNHLGHFLLFQLLKPTLLSSSSNTFNSRVVVVSSSGHRGGKIYFEDFAMKQAGYSPWKAYGQAKLATLHFATELDRRYGGQGLHSNSLHPGGIATPLQRHLDDSIRQKNDQPEVKVYMKNEEQGAATTVWAAICKELEGKGGMYLEDCAVAGPQKAYGVLSPGYSPEAFNEQSERSLWEESLKMIDSRTFSL
jgi:NAD(P)-dependent dehydrogenase (short-subunit alcohol dehydrogenase family)